MELLGKTDDSGGTGMRAYYTVLLKEGIMADVMVVFAMEDKKQIDTVYIMELDDGGTVYTNESDGNSVGIICDYGISEKELISFVLCHMEEYSKHSIELS